MKKDKKEKEADDEDEDDEDNDGILDPKMEKIMPIGGIVAAIIIVIILAVIIGKVLGFGKGSGNKNTDDTEIADVLNEEVEVPSLLGLSYSKAKDELNKLDLGIKLGETKSSDQYDAGQIISQSEEAGTKVDPNTTIIVDVCGDGEKVEVPDVKGYSQAKAESALKALGLTVDITEVASEDVAAGKVISTSPVAGKKIDKSGVVSVVVSKGKEEDQKIEVPAITGKTEAKAKELLKAAGLASGQASQEFSDTVDEGNIISQSPKAGTKVDKDSKVSYVISKGKENKDVYIGNYSGMSESEATSKAQGKGLKVVVDYEYSSSMASGQVTRTEPGNGTTVTAGSTIKIWVSKGTESVSVPDLSGMNASQAQTALSSVGLTLGGTTTGTAAPSEGDSGRIYDWSSKGSSVSKGTAISITVYGAYAAPTPEQPTTPSEGGDTTTQQ